MQCLLLHQSKQEFIVVYLTAAIPMASLCPVHLLVRDSLMPVVLIMTAIIGFAHLLNSSINGECH